MATPPCNTAPPSNPAPLCNPAPPCNPAPSCNDLARVSLRAIRVAALAMRGRHASAEQGWRSAAAAFARRGALAEAVAARMALGRHLLERGRPVEAGGVFAAAVSDVSAQLPAIAASARIWEAAALTDAGRLPAAEARCRAALEDRALSPRDRVHGAATLVRVLLWQDRVDAAEQVVEEFSLDGADDPYARAQVVRVRLRQGDVFSAGRIWHAAPAAPLPEDAATAITLVTTSLRIHAATGDRGGAEAAGRRIEEMASRAHMPLRIVRAQIVLCDLIRRLGDTRAAAALARRLARYEGRVPALLQRAIAAVTRPAPIVLDPAASHAVSQVSSEAEGRLDDTAEAARLIPELVGASRAIADVRHALVRAAGAPFPVHIEGESGVGKEIAARALHRVGARARGPFRALNCAALPDDLLDAELFGHARGAFTGAVADRRGLIEEASGGTLFLDEVADLSPRGQAKLLRVLQEREVRRVGESAVRAVDVRIVSAANRDLRREVDRGAFRLDLFYRLDVIHILIPPLRARPEDVAPLAWHLWREASPLVGSTAALTQEVLDALAGHHWPGNVREMQNIVAALALAAPRTGDVRRRHLSIPRRNDYVEPSGRLAAARARFERGFVERTLAAHGWRPTPAARALGISRQGLAKFVARHGLSAHASSTAT